jgi:hypothetical protein
VSGRSDGDGGPPRGGGDGGRPRTPLAGLRGGPIARAGDPRLSSILADALDVVASEELLPLTHGFHSYPGRFHPELPRRLLAAIGGARRVLDPFCGSGTTLVEAVVAGRAAFGTDVNPLAIRLARLKSTPASAAAREELSSTARAIADRALAEGKAARRAGARPPPTGRATRFDDPRFYPPHVYRELVALRLAIDEAAPPPAPAAREAPGARWLRDALLLSLSSIVVKVSRQRSDTDARLVERHIARGAAARLYAARASLLAEQLAALAAAVPPGTPLPDVRGADARKLRHVPDGGIDLVITSPPYLGTYDYAAHHERRFGWLGLDEKALARFRKSEIGARRDAGSDGAAALFRARADAAAWLSEVARALAPGGLAFVLVGDSRAAGRAIAGDVELRAAADKSGLVVRASASQQRGEPGAGGREHLLAVGRR